MSNMMDNAEEVLHLLEEFSKLKPKSIPRELDEYLGYVAKTGNPVYKWSLVKSLFREKMLNVINDFYEDTLTIELPQCPNVDAFNYDRMKTSLLERLEAFHGAPFTVQRICELLTNPRKEYNRADKFMRAIEKNILVVSTREPGRYTDIDCESTQECSINGVQETGDGLDSTFSVNDLDRGPDASNSTENTEMAEGSVPSTIERTAPDQEMSCDSDENTQENSLPQEEPLPETSMTLDNEEVKYEENDSSHVSSSLITSPNEVSESLSPPSDLTVTESLSAEVDQSPVSISTSNEVEGGDDPTPEVSASEVSPCAPLESPSEISSSNSDDVDSCNIPDLPESGVTDSESHEVDEPLNESAPQPEVSAEEVKPEELADEQSNDIESSVEASSEVQPTEGTSDQTADVTIPEAPVADQSSDGEVAPQSDNTTEQVTVCDTTESGEVSDPVEVSPSEEMTDQPVITQSESMEVDECQSQEDGVQ